MASNLLTLVQNQISGNLLKKVADFLEEDIQTTQKALDVALPSVIGGIANQTAKSAGAEQILNTLTADKMDGSMMDGLGILLGGGSATQGLINYGDKVNKGLFGKKTSALMDWIASYAGIKTGSASGLMGMISPIVMDVIGQKVLGEKTGVSGLQSLLGSQIDVLKTSIPAGLKSVLGLSNLNLDTPSVPQVVTASKRAIEAAESKIEEKTLFSSLLPWLILLGAGVIGLLYLRNCNTNAPEPPATTPIVFDQLPILKVDSIKSIVLPELGDLKIATGSFLDKLYDEIKSPTLDPNKALVFDNVNFATGKADLTESSKTQLSDLVKIMKAYPKVEIKIDGHTDNVGQEEKNKKLSEDRAASVKKYLTDNGIESGRVSTAGFGMAKPVADNGTVEGKAKNRRIEAFVVKK
jgi:OmpA-OmpF porin, OOP family